MEDVSVPFYEEEMSYEHHTKTVTKQLGLPWDKSKDTLSVERGLLELAKIYDLLGLISPTTLAAKQF